MHTPALLLLSLLALNVLFVHSHKHTHTCIHDSMKHPPVTKTFIHYDVEAIERQQKEAQKSTSEDSNSPPLIAQEGNEDGTKRALLQTGTRFTMPLKVLVNYDNLVGDAASCYAAGSVISTSSGSYTCLANDTLTTTQASFLNTIITKAVSLWEDTLAVIPPTTFSGLQGCSSLKPAPSNYSNIPGYNFVLFVTARPIPGGKTLATGSVCSIDSTYERPIIGLANFNPATIDTQDQLAFDSQVAVVVHEMAHALGFSKSFMDRWLLWADATSLTNYTRLTNAQIVQNGYIVTANVKQAGQTHFNCNTNNVAPIESLGGSGTAGSHWQMKSFFNDFMTGVISTYPIYSPMTFAYFKDSGWYGVYSTARIQTLVWGRLQGCSFITDCTTWPSSTDDNPGYQCTDSDPLLAKEECTTDLRAEGQCSKILSVGNPLLESCTYIYAPDEKRCDNPYNTFKFGVNVGEYVGRTSRCFRSNIIKLTKQFAIDPPGGTELTQCYNTSCQSKTSLRIGVSNVWYECPYAGGSISIIGFGGKIKCIPAAADRICLDAVTDNDWPTYTSVTPSTTTPGTVITIIGTNFQKTGSVTVSAQGNGCTSVVVLNDTAVQCTLPPASAFATLSDLASTLVGNNVPVSLVVTDAQGRTAVGYNSMSLTLDKQGAINDFISQYPGWFAAIIIAVVLVIVCIIVIVVKCASK